MSEEYEKRLLLYARKGAINIDDLPREEKMTDEEFRQHLMDAYKSLKNTYNESVPVTFTTEFGDAMKARLAKPDPFDTGIRIGKPIDFTEDITEKLKLEIDSQIIILTKMRKDREFLKALAREDFRILIGLVDGLKYYGKRLGKYTFDDWKRYLLSKGNK